MSSVAPSRRLTIPPTLRAQLADFRKRVWKTKMLEAVTLALSGLLFAFLTVFCIDRIIDPPRSVHYGVFGSVVLLWMSVPYAFHRWVWQNRSLKQVANLLRRREPNIGDQLLGVIELADSATEQARSPVLCAAAIEQVAQAAQKRDLNLAAPKSRIRNWSVTATITGSLTLVLAALVPAAAWNSLTRLVAPWRETPRYTFTQIHPLQNEVVVPHGESVTLTVSLTESTRWRPGRASLELDRLPGMVAQLQGHDYEFQIPPQTSDSGMYLRVGDYVQTIRLVPKLRPELVDARAQVTLPEYLELPTAVEKDVRGGVLSAVEGSHAIVAAKVSRSLRSAAVGGMAVDVESDRFRSPSLPITSEQRNVQLSWSDADGLSGFQPFELAVKGIPDEPPSVATQDLPRQSVILNTEQINFTALAADDFGVKNIGLSWRGIDDALVGKPAIGERLLAPGGPDQNSIQTPGVFSASALGIDPQPIEVRVWAEDYLPNRPRVESAPHTFFVLSPEQHAIWMTEQLSKWHRLALDVRDREMRLHETNKQLRNTPPGELEGDALAKRLQDQATAEAANGRQLANLSRAGEDLIRQASRNSEIGVGHLEKWAEMLQILKDISANRMPSVADLLKQAAVQNAMAANKSNAGPKAGQVRASLPGNPNAAEVSPELENKPKMPTISDVESSQQPAEDLLAKGEESKKKKKPSQPSLRLPTTTLLGPASTSEQEQPEEPQEEPEKMDQAVQEQADLLAEFEKIAEELNAILANLEGSTLVKRLKAAARQQMQVADRISERIDSVFGNPATGEQEDRTALAELAGVEKQSSQTVSYIMDDMYAYYERRRMNQFKLVFDEMRQVAVVNALDELGDEISKVQGVSIAQAEYWSDNLDRWAEDLVDPASSGECPGGKSADSLPPSVILEVLKILEGEVNLREATRVAEKARPGLEKMKHEIEATKLSETQVALQERLGAVCDRIEQLPDGATRFAKDLGLLRSVDNVMLQAVDILRSGETGEPAIAAETEAIELLLKSQRVNPKAGGGGGNSPGGGGEGTTQDSALALIGAGVNPNEKKETREIQQATGETGSILPEEFRAGLDIYFSKLEKGE